MLSFILVVLFLLIGLIVGYNVGYRDGFRFGTIGGKYDERLRQLEIKQENKTDVP
jgi:hypothetical protein